ncbi:CarD family transcriptional regulator [Olsenella sp. HMSC062G07]|uniref:CarD family transcriptional regulator n=1 Tax=Olsenella sp. HMSC062G07 TaxID=1739330 RepID=UPI0008A2EDE3|nr:CarD family transcriptional regulator [Olsenella sp. HMSC062G07]OFK23314.1 CarD family transcriptional regulator [Olsenella sp. HMSC062G07]
MYNVGEFIVHPGQGVCKVEKIVESPQAAYMLMPVSAPHPMRISYPVDRGSRLRPVVSRQEARDLIGEYTDLPIDSYTSNSAALEEKYFKDKIRRGSCLDSVRTVKTFRRRIAEARANNRKPPVVYERLLKQACERSLEELSVALDLSKDDVAALFQSGQPAEANAS